MSTQITKYPMHELKTQKLTSAGTLTPNKTSHTSDPRTLEVKITKLGKKLLQHIRDKK